MENELIKIERDGNKWNVLWGSDPIEGIEGFGDTIEEAMIEFAKEVLKWAEFPDIKESEVKMEGTKPDMIIEDDLDPKMAGNLIKGHIASRGVTIDGKYLSPEKSQKVYNHSPDGFAWGYGGSGPAQLALAIVLEFTEERLAQAIYQDFKVEHVAKWPFDEDFETRINIQGWIKTKDI